MDCCHTNWYLKKSYAQKPESRVNAFSDSIWINDVFYLETQRYDRDYHYMSFQRTPATETQFAAASKQNQQDWRETIKEQWNIQLVVRHSGDRNLSPAAKNWECACLRRIERLFGSCGHQDNAKTLCFATKTIMTNQNVVECQHCMLDSLELNFEFKLAQLPACCPISPSPLPATKNISLP